MSASLRIVVAPNGQTRVETVGYTGSDCRQASAAFEQALGLKTREELTSGFYASAQQPHTQQTDQSHEAC